MISDTIILNKLDPYRCIMYLYIEQTKTNGHRKSKLEEFSCKDDANMTIIDI